VRQRDPLEAVVFGVAAFMAFVAFVWMVNR
jgi:hypothetical protein